MKRAKIVLTALTVLTLAGGALAFKAQKMNGNLFCTTIKEKACARDNANQLITFITTTQAQGTIGYCTLSVEGDKCSTVSTTVKVTVDE